MERDSDCSLRIIEVGSESPNMAKKYSESALKGIGAGCSNRLPPASAVQAMFLYEMQRETELERLFQGQMFRLAEAEDYSKSQEARAFKLEDQLKAFQKQLTETNLDGRFSKCRIRMDALQSKLTDQDHMLQRQAERLPVAETKIAKLESKQQEFKDEETARQIAFSEHAQKLVQQAEELHSLMDVNKSTDDDIAILFDERDALVAQLAQANERITKLEELVRALTGQTSSNGSSPTTSQLLPVQTTNGQSLGLSVPKGSSVVSYRKENQAPIRSFTPGKQWAA